MTRQTRGSLLARLNRRLLEHNHAGNPPPSVLLLEPWEAELLNVTTGETIYDIPVSIIKEEPA